jgi:two-component system, NarL family, nitrate/nitrite response regulator NarL
VALALAEREDDVLTWVESGISGYIPRSAALGDVVALLEGAMRDEQLCSPRIASSLVRRIAIGLPTIPSGERKSLTQRELEIVKLVSEGLSNKEIANSLKIGLATTKSHVHNALGKLGLVRRGQAAQWMRDQIQSLKQRNSAERSG